MLPSLPPHVKKALVDALIPHFMAQTSAAPAPVGLNSQMSDPFGSSAPAQPLNVTMAAPGGGGSVTAGAGYGPGTGYLLPGQPWGPHEQAAALAWNKSQGRAKPPAGAPPGPIGIGPGFWSWDGWGGQWRNDWVPNGAGGYMISGSGAGSGGPAGPLG